jgi:hypothetical protein
MTKVAILMRVPLKMGIQIKDRFGNLKRTVRVRLTWPITMRKDRTRQQ